MVSVFVNECGPGSARSRTATPASRGGIGTAGTAAALDGAKFDGVGTTDGAGECIGLIGLKWSLDGQQQSHHPLNHGFVRFAGTGDGFLDFARSEFLYGKPGQVGSDQSRSPGLSKAQRALRIDIDKHSLGGGQSRCCPCDDQRERFRNMAES